MNDMATILKYVTAFIMSLVLAVFGFRMFTAGIDMIRYGAADSDRSGFSTGNMTVSYNDEYYWDDEEDEYPSYYEEDALSEEEQREIDERIAFLESNTDFGFFDQNFVYMMTSAGEDYLNLFFDEGWMLRDDYLGYEGEEYDLRMEFWEADSERFETIAYVFNYEVMVITFKNSEYYMYCDVDKDTLAGLLRTDSQDEYFDEYISGKFESKKLGEI